VNGWKIEKRSLKNGKGETRNKKGKWKMEKEKGKMVNGKRGIEKRKYESLIIE
jgi:hypothetical protein